MGNARMIAGTTSQNNRRSVLQLLVLLTVVLTSCGWSQLTESAKGSTQAPDTETSETETPEAETPEIDADSVDTPDGDLLGPEQLSPAPVRLDTSSAEEASDTTTATTTSSMTSTTSPPAPRLFGDMIAPRGTRSTWSGTIGEGEGAREFALWLGERNGYILGEISYADTEASRTVAGHRLDNGVYLHEFARNGRVAATFTSTSIVDGEFGELSAGDNPVNLTLEAFVEDDTIFAGGLLAGTYVYEFAPFQGAEPCCGPSGSLTLTDLTGDTAWVSIATRTGAPSVNLAVIAPTAVSVFGNTARYEERNDWLDCAFDIVAFGDVVFVDHLGEQWECGFGANASVQGIFVRSGA